MGSTRTGFLALLFAFHFNTIAENSEQDRIPASLRRDAITERQEQATEDLSITGIIEVGFSVLRDFDKKSSSDITNDTIQLDIEKKLTPLTSARITLLYEDDGESTPHTLEIDEGLVIIGDEVGPYLKAGKMILEGSFSSEFITDPLTQDLAETNQTALALGYRTPILNMQVFSYKGDTSRENTTNKVNSFGVHLSTNFNSGATEFKLTTTYKSNAADADVLASTEVFNDKDADGSVNDLATLVDSLEVGADIENDHFVIHAEWFTTLGRFKAVDLDFKGRDTKLSALKLEGGLKLKTYEKDTLLLVGYQSTSEALGVGLPASRWLLGAKTLLTRQIELSYEYKYETDYAKNNVSKGNAATGGFAQTHSVLLGLSF